MTTIYIAHNEHEDGVTRVIASLRRVAMYDPNWNGAKFEVERAECTYIDCDDPAGTQLLYEIIYPALLH